RLRAEGVVLDLCPTANWKCKAVQRLEDHPLPQLVRGGVRCTISTDSRTVAGTTLSEEYQIAQDVMGMNAEELQLVRETAYDARFSDGGCTRPDRRHRKPAATKISVADGRSHPGGRVRTAPLRTSWPRDLGHKAHRRHAVSRA